MKLAFYLISTLAAALWAGVLVAEHHAAVAHLLEPSVLCGGDADCGQVLGSSYATVLGIPVSAPGVALYGFLFVAGLWGSDPSRRARVSTMAVGATLLALAFSGWLLFHMLVTIGQTCGYCLVMDGLTLTVMLSSLLLHPTGPRSAFRDLAGLPANLLKGGMESGLVPAVLMGTLMVHVFTVQPVPAGDDRPVEVVLEATPEPSAHELPSAATTHPAPTRSPMPARPAVEGTKRVVINPAVTDFALPSSVPFKGPDKAPAEIVVFEDFQCPYCRKLTGNLAAAMADLGNKVRVGFVHFPMHSSCNKAAIRKDLHPYACGAAEAAVCAQEQGKFWEMHDTLFHNNAHLKARDLEVYASQVGLDMTRFRTCMRSDSAIEKVLSDSIIGQDAGVTGTPTMFVNGRRMSGAQNPEVLVAVVEAILAADSEERLVMDIELEGESIGEIAENTPTSVRVNGPSGPFEIDAFEAQIVDGVAVVKAGVEPARGVTWFEADAACKAAGKRLCSEREWLTACTGAFPVDGDGDGLYSDDRILGRLQPYGQYRHDGWCLDGRNPEQLGDIITGNHPKCATPDGIYDLVGVTKEWVGQTPSQAGLKGGSYLSTLSGRCGYLKDSEPPDLRDPSIGFRCCAGGEVAPKEEFIGGKVGDQILSWAADLSDRGRLSVTDLKGKAYVVTFWATWCGPCKQKLPILSRLRDEYADQGFEAVAVNIDSDPAVAKRFLRTTGYTFPVVLDPGQDLMKQFDTAGVPTAFYVTRSGYIRQRKVGFSGEREEEQLRKDIEGLLAAE